MLLDRDWSDRTLLTIIGGVGAIATLPGMFLLAAKAQTTYPDVEADYWAQPFIQQLSEEGILTGYPDGTFRPEQPIDRDEYAAVIRQAFEADPVRSIPAASAFEDVPEDYWASAAIEEVYEAGFMGTPDTSEFEPQTEISRVDAIVALVEGLGLSEADAPTVAVPAAAEPVQPVRQKRQPSSRLLFPLASTAMMQLFAPPAQAAQPVPAPPAAPPSAQATGSNPDISNTAELDLSGYYTDADQIPDYARDEVALATRTGLIANYPEVNVLNPNQPITRGGTAALIHQALVYQNRLEPLPAAAKVSPDLAQ